jgi:hypothetical protein
MSLYPDLRAAVLDACEGKVLGDLLKEAEDAKQNYADPELRVSLAEVLARHLDELQTCRKDLHGLEASVVSKLARVMPVDRLEFAGLLLIRRPGLDRKEWDHPGLARAVTLPFALNPETGEIDSAAAEYGGLVVAELLKHAQISYWRKGTLEAAGVDLDEYCQTSPGKASVELQRGGGS